LPVDAEASGRQDVGHSLRDGCEAGDRGRALPDGDGVGASSTAGWQEQQPGAFGAGAVADASSGRRSPEFNPRSGGTAASGRQGDAQSGGADVADTDGAGQRAGGRGRVDSAGHAGPQPDLGCQAPADAGGARLQDGRPGGLEAQAAYRSGHGHLRSRWSPEPGVGRVAHGIPRRVDRLRGLGNAVVPQVVAEIGRAIMSASR
jgi:DNA (cytosine-5)-methyltransferase 1